MARKPARTRDNEIGEKVVVAVGLLGGEATKAEIEKELGRTVTSSLFTKLVRDSALWRPRPGVYGLARPVAKPSVNGARSVEVAERDDHRERLGQAMNILFPDGASVT